MSDSFRTHGLQHARLPCPSSIPKACSNSCPSSRWCHPIISSSVVPFSSHLQSFPASSYFPVSQFFTSGSQSWSSWAPAWASVLPVNIQGWFPLVLTCLISLLSKEHSGLLEHHNSKASILQCLSFFMVQLSHPYVTTGKTTALTITHLCWQSDVSAFKHSV